MKRFLSALAAVSLFVGGASSALACEMAGHNKHVGNIVAIDMQNGTFAILDAETQQQIRFTASPDLLASIAVDELVTVAYQPGSDGELISQEIVHI